MRWAVPRPLWLRILITSNKGECFMGWLFSIVFMIGYCFNSDPIWLIASGLFGIAGSIEGFTVTIRKIFRVVFGVNLGDIE